MKKAFCGFNCGTHGRFLRPKDIKRFSCVNLRSFVVPETKSAKKSHNSLE